MPSLKELISAIQRAELTSLQAWYGRTLIWFAAAISGLCVVLFAWLSEWANTWFSKAYQGHTWLPLLLTPIAGMSIVWVTRTWFMAASGSGIPQTIAAIQLHESARKQLVSFRIAVAKIILGTAGLAAGFSSGREGPSVQIAASIMHGFSRFLPKPFSVEPSHMILAGGAAGISAAFNTPLAGIVFAIEELGRRFEQKTNGIIITAIVLSGLVSISIQGNYAYFGNLNVGTINRSILLPILVCGIVCGVSGGIFSRLLIRGSTAFPKRVHEFRNLRPVLWAGLCGLCIALIGIYTHGATFGSGYHATQTLLHQNNADNLLYAPLKYLATWITYLSGIPGGIFAPSLSIGAGIGNNLVDLFPSCQPEAICALCMVGFLAAGTQAPLTSFIIVMEMIDGHEMVTTLMAVAMFSAVISRLFSSPLYTSLAEHYYKQSADKEK